MGEELKSKDATGRSDWSREIGAKEARKLQAKEGTESIWLGLAKSGVVGWSISILMLAGAAFGLWLDSCHPAKHSWTLMFLVIGLALGCLSAWHWIVKEMELRKKDKGAP